MKKIFYLFLIFNLFIISACGSSGNSSSGSSNTVIPPYTISINGPDTVYTSSENNYTITTVPEGIAVTDIEWLIDNETIAAIDTNGVLTVNNITGQVTITANANGKTATKLVNIIKQLEITGNNITAINGIITLKVLYNTTNNITWNSSNPAVATVENGVVTGVSAGTTDITVSENGNTSAAFTITIKDVPNGYEVDENGAYNVYSVEGFKKWVEAVTTNSSTDCNLYSDLDFANSTPPMLIDSYQGIFEGNGHIIRNYSISGNNGFINSLISGKLSNVTFDNVNVTFTSSGGEYSSSDVGIVTSNISSESIIENVRVTNSTLTANSNNGINFIGIIAGGSIGATIKNCSITNSTLTVNDGMSNTGGILGIANMNTTVLGCFVENLKITTEGGKFADSGIGAIIGKQSGDSSNTIIGCGVTNTTITNNGTYGYVGGLVGHGNHGNFSASYFYGSLSNTSGYSTGLDFGYFNNTNGTASANFVKKQNGTVDTIIDQNGTTLIDNTTVTWIDAVNNMNQYLTDNNYTDFSFRYDESKGYPVIDYAK